MGFLYGISVLTEVDLLLLYVVKHLIWNPSFLSDSDYFRGGKIKPSSIVFYQSRRNQIERKAHL